MPDRCRGPGAGEAGISEGRMKLRRVGPLSCAKMAGVLYAALGLIFGCFVSAAALFGVALGAGAATSPGRPCSGCCSASAPSS